LVDRQRADAPESFPAQPSDPVKRMRDWVAQKAREIAGVLKGDDE
jgi:hypothetical protein